MYAIIDEVSNRSRWLRWVLLFAALLLLNVSVTFVNAWPTPGIRWRGALSIELGAGLLLLVLISRWLGPPSRAVLRSMTVFWLLLALGHYADVTSPALYGRDINLYWDLRFVPDVVALLARPERLWLVLFAAIAALLILVLLYTLLRWAVGRIGNAMPHAAERRVVGVLGTAMVLLFVAQRVDSWSGGPAVRVHVPAIPVFSVPVTQMYARQASLVAQAFGGSKSIPPSPPIDSDLSLVKGADVLLLFEEAYGAVSYDRPEFAARLAAPRAELDAGIRDTHRRVVSAYVESPTFGGSSWLAHITLLSGVEVRDHQTNTLLMTQKRETLVNTFKRGGYRTVAVMPGMWQDWPEGAFYGFDEIYGGERLAYRGPQFGWWNIPDQFALAKIDALEIDRSSRPPLFVFFPTISTHVPFTPTPPYQADWRRMLTDHPYDLPDIQRAFERQPDWLDLGPDYVIALSYAYRLLTGYLRAHPDRDFVMILIGDHQPAAAVTGERASWDVPVHVITSRRPVLERLLAHGFREGLTPRHPDIGHMNGLLPVLLDAFGRRDIAAAAPH